MSRDRIDVCIPCYNEGRNVVTIAEVVTTALPTARVIFLDDCSDGPSQVSLQEAKERFAVSVITANVRRGKSANLTDAFRRSAALDRGVIVVDCDVLLNAATLVLVAEALEKQDLVAAAACAIDAPRTFVEHAMVYSSRLQHALRGRYHSVLPAFCVVGRLFGLSVAAQRHILASSIPEHTEDAHYALVVLDAGLRLCYLPDAIVFYRAPATYQDYLRQANRFRDGIALLLERWPAEMLARLLLPKASQIVPSLCVTLPRDLIGGMSYILLALSAALAHRLRPISRSGTWAVSESTKAV